MTILVMASIKSVATFQSGRWVRLYGQFKMYKSRIVFRNSRCEPGSIGFEITATNYEAWYQISI